MARIEKYTNAAVCNILRHNMRTIKNNSNKDIDPSLSHLNYKFPMTHYNSDYSYFKQRCDEFYLYGRGSSREKDAVTLAGWVITAPDDITGDQEKEKLFFRGCYDFICDRYGDDNIINNVVHCDEIGKNHLHVNFIPVTDIDFNKLHFKTIKLKTFHVNEYGRYESDYKFALDKNGTKIPLKNYSKAADNFTEKISAADVLNKAELSHFHQDLQKYLLSKRIEGTILNGKTGNQNFTVKELKTLTHLTGLKLGEIQQIQKEYLIQKHEILKLQHENQELKIQHEEDLKIIQSLTESVSHEEKVDVNIRWGNNTKHDFDNEMRW